MEIKLWIKGDYYVDLLVLGNLGLNSEMGFF
jgi:hypothetical protein